MTTKDLQLTIGKNIKEHRISNGFSQKSFGEVTGHSQHYISEIENGYYNLTLATILKFAEALQVHPSRLLVDA
jgi:transcriptional regulator with XRE-family HTH domain